MSDEVSRKVDELLKEREKYTAWLEKLERERTQATERAYSRVRGDYQKRLAEVDEQLRSHSDSIQNRVSELQSSVSQLEEERAGRAERLEEARLRRSVGEYRDDAEWTELETGLLEDLEESEAELASARDEIARLTETVTLVQGAKSAPPKAAPESAASGGASRDGQGGGAEAGADSAAEGAGAGGDDDDDLVSLEDLVLGDEEPGLAGLDETAAEGGGADESRPAAQSGADEAAEGGGGGGVGDELAFLESLSLEADDLDSLSFLDQHGRGQVQTILCPNCSAANDPAEWYCTECGEELPAE